MSYPRVTLAWAVCLAALAAGCVGCSDREEKAAEGSEGIDSPEPPMLGWVGADDLVFYSNGIGEDDDAGRYSSAVLVSHIPQERPDHKGCAGVLLASNLVLTAAHCLCTPKRGETIRFDGSECAAKVRVATTYCLTEATPSDPLPDTRTSHRNGDVLIHPQFQIVLDARGAVVSSRADLAVIRLEHPVPEISPVRLATEEVKAREVLSVVGYQYTDDGVMFGRRMFNREKVQAPAEGERVLFGSMDMAGYKGDTGGPCLRETKQGLELVGISQRGLGLTPTFTRIAPYREWLEEQIRLAGGKR